MVRTASGRALDGLDGTDRGCMERI